MTSKISFSKLIRNSLKNQVWSFAFSCLMFMGALPLYAAFQEAVLSSYMEQNGKITLMQYRTFARNVFGEQNYFIMAAVCFVGVIAAINAFSYMYSRSKVDMYHSLPLSRKELFAAGYLTGIINFVVPYIVNLALALITAVVTGALSEVSFKMVMLSFVLALLGFIGIFTSSVAVMMLTGNTGDAFIAIAIVQFYIPILIEILDGYANEFLLTHSYYSEMDVGGYHSPLIQYLGLYEGMDTFNTVLTLSPLRVIEYVIFIFIALGIALWLYCIRKSEAAGHAIAFEKTRPVISVVLLVLAGLTGGLFLESMAPTVEHAGWLITGILLSIVVGHFVIQAVIYRDFKALIKNLLNPAIALLITGIIVVAVINDMTGYDNYIPSEDEFESAAFMSSDMQVMSNYITENGTYDEFGDKNNVLSVDAFRSNMQVRDYELVRDFAQAGIKDMRTVFEQSGTSEQQYGIGGVAVTVRYNLKGGRRVYRQYRIRTADSHAVLARLYDNDEYKKGVFDILTVDDERIEDFTYENAAGRSGVKLSKEQSMELVTAYREELLALKSDELAQAFPIGCIGKEITMDSDLYEYSQLGYVGYVYSNFDKTMALLESYGIDLYKGCNARDIAKIEIFRTSAEKEAYDYTMNTYNSYDVPGNMNMAFDGTDGDENEVIIDPDEIEKMYDKLVAYEYAIVDDYLRECKWTDVGVFFDSLDGGFVSYYYKE